MAINDKIKSLYDTLKADGADVGSEQEFNDWFLAKGDEGYKNRKSVYDAFKADGADVGKTYEEFRDWLGLHPQTQTRTVDSTSKKPASANQPVAASPSASQPYRTLVDMQASDNLIDESGVSGLTAEQNRKREAALFPYEAPGVRGKATPKVASQEYMGWQKAAKEARDKLFSGPAANGGKIPNYFQDVAPIQERAELADRERKAVRDEYDKENFEGFYQANVKPVFEAEKTAGEKRASANDAFNNMALQAAGYDRETSLAVAARQAVDVERETDPAKIAQNTVKAVEQGKVDDYVLGRIGFDDSATTDGQESAPLSDEEKLLFYQLYGKEVSEVTDMMVQRMYREYQAAGAPKKDLDYILGKAVHDNVAATLMKALTRKMAGSSGLREQFRQQAYQQYGKDASWLTRAAGSAAPFAVDVLTGGFALPSLAGKGAVKGVTNWMARNAAKTVSERAAGEVTKAAAKEMSTAALGRYLATNAPVMNVLVNSIGGAANFGTYEMQGEMIRQFGNDEFEPMQLLKAFGHGAALGGVMGVAGNSIGSLTKGAGVAGKVAGDVAGVAAETGIFAADNALEKAREDGVSILDVDWAEIAGESLGMVLGMKVVGGLMSPKSLRERYAKSPDYDLKLDERNRKELEGAGYNFSNIFKGMNEVADMIPLTLTKTKEFGASANKTRQIGEEEKVEVNSRVLDDLMKNPAISSDTKRKVFYLATGKILTPERVFHADMDIHEDGSATITTTNVAGDVISVKDYDDVRDADKVYQKRNAEAKANTLYGLDLLFKQFGIAERMESRAKNLTKEATGIDIDDVLPKKESERSGSEQAAVDAYIKNLQDSFIEWNNANKMRIAAEEAVRQGRDMQTPEEVHESERKMAAAGELLDEKTKRTLESMYEAGMNEENSAELTKIFEKYPDAREYFIGLGNRKGVDQQVNDKIAAAVAAERERMSQFIDADGSGYLIPVEYNGRKGYVVSGNDDEVIVKFEDNGDELPVLSGDEGLLYAEGEPNTLEDYMAQYEQRLTEQMRGEVENARMNHPLTKLEPVPGETIDTMDGKKRVAAVNDNGIFLEEPVMVLDEETGQMVPKHQKEFRPEDAVSLEEFVQKQNEYYDGMEQQERENTRMRQQAENYEPVEAVDYEQEGKADEMPVQGFDAGDVKPVSGEAPADYEAAEGYEGGYDEGVTVDWREEQAKAERKKADDAIVERMLDRDEKLSGRFVKNNLDAIEDKLKKARKKESKATDLDQFEKETAEFEAEVAALEAEKARWENIDKRIRDGRLEQQREVADDAIAKKKVSELGEPQSLREWIMRSLYNGGVKMIWGDSSENATKGLGSHTGLGRSNEEMRKRLWMLANRDKGGLYPEEAAERMLSSYASDMGWQGTEGDWPITSQDVLDELLDVVSAYGTKSSMGNAAVEANASADNSALMTDEEEQYEKDAWAKDANFNSYEEYEDYLDMVEHSVEPYTKEEYEQNKIDIAERYEEEFLSLQQNKPLNTQEDGETNLQPSETGVQGRNGLLPEEGSGEARGIEGSADEQREDASLHNQGAGIVSQGEGAGQGVSVAQSASTAPTDLRDAVKPESAALGAFEKKNSALDNTTDTGKTSERGKRNDTATPQSTVSGGKGTEVSDTKQGEEEKSVENQISAREWNGHNVGDRYILPDGSGSIEVIGFDYTNSGNGGMPEVLVRGYDTNGELMGTQAVPPLAFEESLKEMQKVEAEPRNSAEKAEAAPSYLPVLRKEYDEFKKKYPDNIIMFRTGDTFTFLADDTVAAEKVLGVEIKEANGERYATIPYESLGEVLPKFINALYRVATAESIDYANPVQVAEAETDTNPTEAQKKAGNYKMGHVKIDGYDVTIENPKGSTRSGKDASGKEWSIKMNNTYGYIRGTEGVDGDHIDVFLSDDPTSGDVFVVDQVNKDGSFDEHKVMYGFPDMESARKAYLSNYEEGWQGLGAITPVSKDEFKKWVESSHRKTKPFAEYSSVKPLGDVQQGNAVRGRNNQHGVFLKVGDNVSFYTNGKIHHGEIIDFDGNENFTIREWVSKRDGKYQDVIRPFFQIPRLYGKQANVEASAAGTLQENGFEQAEPLSETDPVKRAQQIVDREKKTAEDIEAGGAVVDKLQDMGIDVSADMAENRQVRKQAEKDNSEAGKMRSLKTLDGKEYGFTYRGKMYLDPRKIDAELPLHEYGHLWCEAFRTLNPQGWNQVVETIKQDAEGWEMVKNLYPELQSESEIAEEVITTFSGKKGAQRLKEELERMAKKDSNYKSRWNNVYQNIVKAIKDFWGKIGDFLGIKYETPEQVYDQVLKDFASGMNPRARVEKYLKDRNSEYMKAASSGDVETATKLFNEALQEEIGNGMTPFVSVGRYSEVRQLAHKVKSRDPKIIQQVAEMMAPLVPENAVLVPAPSHTGEATDMLDLANAIAKMTGCEVADVLKSAPRESQYQTKKQGGLIQSSGMGITMNGELPADKIPVVIDNVVDSGNTAEACVKALGKGVVVSLGNSADAYGHAATLKSAKPIARDRRGRIVPLDERFDLGKKYLDNNSDSSDRVGEKPAKSLLQLELFSDEDFAQKRNAERPKVSDEELLASIPEGKGEDVGAIQEYDRRHFAEYTEELNAYYDMLEREGSDLDDAYSMFNDVYSQWMNGAYKTAERTKLLAQMNALQEYIDEKEMEREEEEERAMAEREAQAEAQKVSQQAEAQKARRETFEQQKKEIRSLGYDLTQLSLRPLKKGETSHVERRYVENGSFGFTGTEHIESIDDVAFIFRQLQNAAAENAFIVMVKDGVPTVIHVGTGSYMDTVAAGEQAFAAYKAINPDKLFFVHNHPSGRLVSSRDDRELMGRMQAMYGDKMYEAGIIINTTSGKYGLFDAGGDISEQQIDGKHRDEMPVKVFSFSRNVFDADWNPETAFKMRNTASVAEFISSHRLGKHKKLNLLVLTNDGAITGNVFLPWTNMRDASTDEAADMIANYMHQMGGTAVLLYGNVKNVNDVEHANTLKKKLYNRKCRMIDVVRVNDSMLEHGVLKEPEMNEQPVISQFTQYERDNAEGTIEQQGGLVKNELSDSILSKSWRGALHVLGRNIGRRIVILSGEDTRARFGNGVQGFYDESDNTLYLNEDYVKDNENLRNFVLGHEMTHILKSENPEVWNAYVGTVKAAMGEEFQKEFDKKRERYDAFIEKYNRTHERKLRKLSDAAIEEEVSADWAGRNVLTDEEAVKKILDDAEKAGADPVSLTKRILDAINQWLAQLKQALKNAVGKADEIADNLKFAEQAKKLWQDMYNVAVARQNAKVDKATAEESSVDFSLVYDPIEVARLESEPKDVGYRNVVLNEDGTLGSPMADKLGKKGAGRKKTSGFEMSRWERSDENPDLADENGKIDLIKPDGKTVGKVDYNPYIHIRPDKVNKQFKQAWERPNLVYVETMYPTSELTSGFHAEKAKKSVGMHDWNGGKLILSRWDKPVRIVPWEEVADDWVKEFEGRGVEFDIVPPALLPILSERGVEILPPHKGMGKECVEAYEEWKEKNAPQANISLDKFRARDKEVELKNLKGDGLHRENYFYLGGKLSKFFLGIPKDSPLELQYSRCDIMQGEGKKIRTSHDYNDIEVYVPKSMLKGSGDVRTLNLADIRDAVAGEIEKMNGDNIVRFSLADEAERDQEYADAVAAGETEKALSAVEVAAKMAMPNTKVVDENGEPKVVYHGSKLQEFYYKDGNPYTRWIDRFNVFNEGRGYFTDNETDARNVGRGKTGLYSCYLNIKKPFVFDAKGARWDEIEFNGKKYQTTDSVVRWAKEHGEYDGVIIKNVIEPETQNPEPITDYVAFSPNQIKSAWIEYDDNGKLVPLSKRFSEKDDIRFSLADEEKREERRESEESKALFETAKKRFGTTLDIREAGYVLPDGSMLDFSGRHSLDSGMDASYLRGGRTVDHREVANVLNYKEDGNTPSGITTSMSDFIERGAIRIDSNAGTINLFMKPTSKQKGVLRQLVAKNDGYVSVDFGNGDDSEHYVEYENVRPLRVLSAIDKYYDDGIKPESNVRFSLADEESRDQEYADAVAAGETEKALSAVEVAAKMAMPNTKVVDKNGEPMVVYHQTGNDFTVFDPRHKGAGTNDYQVPFGIFMKPSAKSIGVGGDKQMALYANIRKPLRVANRQELSTLLKSRVKGYKETLAEYEKIDKEYSKKFDEAMKYDHDIDVENWNKWKAGEMTEEEYQNAISDTAEDVINQWKEAQSKPIAKMKELVDNYFKDSEYDGIWIAKDEGSLGRSTETIIAFEPNQVKSAGIEYDDNGNLIPLSERFSEKDDIRFSLDDGVGGRELAPNGKKYMNPRDAVPKVRGGWNERKIKEYLKHNPTRSGVRAAARAITEFDSPEELQEHMFYHGTAWGSDHLKPSITMSDRDIERYGGGGYGEKYWGISISKDKRIASRFSGTSSNVRIYPIILLKGAKVIERPDFTDAIDAEDHIAELWNDGVDAVWIGEGKQGKGEQELLILNPRAVVNIGTPDFYRQYRLGHPENPLRIADAETINRMYETAKQYVEYPVPAKPKKPSIFVHENGTLKEDENGHLVYKTDEQYNAEMEEYNRQMEEYNNSAELRDYQDMESQARRDIRFSLADDTPFYSNAEKAVENIKQEKATPEQWLKMIEKNGGLKAGEDKWMGLSDWLKDSDTKTLTKDEVLDYIRKNEIQIEEVNYSELNNVDDNEKMKELKEEFAQIQGELTSEKENLEREIAEFDEEMYEKYGEGWYNQLTGKEREYADATENRYRNLDDSDDAAFREMVSRYGDDFEQGFEVVGGELEPVNDYYEGISGAARYFLDINDKPINSTRMDYTTEGLDNKREIALVVPSVESWNAGDEIHFGDAGEGRAVAWVRFGETTDADGNKVLVIDEIQSKRHQEGREKGYQKEPPADAPEVVAYKKADKEVDDYLAQLRSKYKRDDVSYGLTEEENARLSELHENEFKTRVAYNKYLQENHYGAFSDSDVPDAPFDKNWHELAMKRMLRYAAENGYDKVAWTKGEQQAERYSLGKVYSSVEREDNPSVNGKRFVFSGENVDNFTVDDNGVVIDATLNEAVGKSLGEVVGKDLAVKMMGMENGDMLDSEELRIGGEGMKGFYNQILPRFMDKYGKKWGVKTGEIELPDLGDQTYRLNSEGKMKRGLTMWAVDVTPEMKESVMQGQPMFSLADDIESVEPRIFSNILTKAILLTANSNKDNLQKKADAIKRVVEQLEEKMQKLKEGQKVLPVAAGAVRSAATAQKEYDRGTVNNFVEFAKVVMDAGMMDDVTKGEVKRLLNLAKGVVSKEQIEKSLNAVADLIIDHSLRESKNLLKKQLSVKGSKVDSKGVEVQGKLDVEGQRVMSALKDGMKMDREALQNRLADVIDRMGSNNEVVANNASSEYEGLMLAKQYLEDIKASEMEESELKHEYQLAKDMLKEGEMDRESFKEFEESFRDNIRQMKMERIEAYQKLVLGIGGNIAKSFDAAKAFKEAEQERIKAIQHNANSDLEGIPATTQSELPWTSKLANAGLVRFFMQPVATFDEMLRFLGQKSVDGRGYLWNRYMTAWTKATDQLWNSTKEAHDELDKKVKEIFAEGTFIGKDGRVHKFPKIERWSDLFSLERKMEGADVEYWDDGKKTYHLSEGKLLYIYMVNKMKDGEMKLRKMGITEADVEAIKDHLNPSFIELADWIQSEFLPKRRVKYNEVYKRMFGADMAAIDNYFPLKIDKNALNKEEDISAYDGRADINPATITGSVIKRTRNASALDLMHTDAFDLVLSHLDDMERWAAFAEFNRDLNTLLSYKKFRNRLQNMTSGRFGAGKTLLENFKTVAAIAGGAYRPHVKADSVDSTMVNLAKGVTAAKISLRVYTAFKQLLSYPAYLSEANLMELAKSSNPVGAYKAWNWAMENLPLFAERWQSRQAGDYRLKETDMDWQVWKNDLVRTAARIGMSPNAFVDAMTVAMGAKAVYETARKRYAKDGYDAETANEKALLDASIAYNETQQSSQSAFMSAMQLDRTAASVALTVFRNASMAYERRMMRALHNMKNRLTDPDYKDESRAFMQKMMEREGVNEEQAKKASKRMYRRQMWRDIVDVAVFGYILQAAWNLAPYLPYLIAGDDDDEKKKMLEDALRHAMFGGIEGLTGGSLMSEVGNLGLQIAAEDDDKKLQSLKQRARYQDFNLLPLMSDLQGVMNKSLSGDKSALVDGVNLLIQSGIGVNPQTFSDGVVASVDAFNGDLGAWKEFAFAMARIFQTPSSSMDMLYIDELGMFAHDARRLKMEDLAKRWARYKMMKENPLLRWAYTDDEEKELEEKLIKRFENKVKERVSDMDDKEVEKMLIQSQPGMEQQLLLKEMKSRYKKEAETLEGEALRKAFDEAELLDERKELAKDIAKEEGASRDPYGAKTEKVHEQQYQLLRTAEDVREDAQLLKMQEDAEAAGNDARKKAISKMRSQVMEARKGLGAGDDEKVMETIRKSRRALIDELGKK